MSPIGAMDDVFGNRPDRPDHPDFWKLSSIVLMLDGAAQADEDVFETRLKAIVDPSSALYIAVQRAIRLLGVRSVEAGDPRVAVIGGGWLDGFLTGVLYVQGGSPNPESGSPPAA